VRGGLPLPLLTCGVRRPVLDASLYAALRRASMGSLPRNRGKSPIFCVTEMPSNAVAVLSAIRARPAFVLGPRWDIPP